MFGRSSSVMNICIHMTSLTPVKEYSAHMYSASMLEVVMHFCFADFHCIKFFSRMIIPVYECRSLISPVQSAWIRIVGVCTRLGTGARSF